MTIHIVKWTDKQDNTAYRYACSSYNAAQKKVNEITKNPQLQLVHSEDNSPVHTYKPKVQTDVINLINSL